LLKFKIEINRAKCIACGQCYSLDPIHFEPGKDLKSKVVGGINTDKSEGSFEDENIADAQEAEESCPVSIIKVTIQP
jgi:ferredoxin